MGNVNLTQIRRAHDRDVGRSNTNVWFKADSGERAKKDFGRTRQFGKVKDHYWG